MPKDGLSMFWLMVGLRLTNLFTVKHQFSVAEIEQEVCRLSFSYFFTTMNLFHRFWQLPLSKFSHRCQSFITRDVVYMLTRVLYGTTSAVMPLQSILGSLVFKNHEPLIPWLPNDNPIHTSSFHIHIKADRKCFRFCAEVNFKLYPAMSTVASTATVCCKRIISAEGLRFDFRRKKGIQTMNHYQTRANLQQYVSGMQYIQSGTQNFSTVVSPLSYLLKTFMKKLESAPG